VTASWKKMRDSRTVIPGASKTGTFIFLIKLNGI